MSLTSESGDQIGGPCFVHCDPLVSTAVAGEAISCPGRMIFAEGTGAFAEVSGSAFLDAYVWFPGSLEAQGWPWVEVLRGSIAY